jgi:hypothetical protein
MNKILLRKEGIDIANRAGAVETAGVIATKSACYKEIFSVAVRELGTA